MAQALAATGLKGDIRFFDQWNDPDALKPAEYVSMLLDSVFVACPDGNNPETFRFYEALECGAIPLVVRTEANSVWVDWVAGALGIRPADSWPAAAAMVKEMFARPAELLEPYREEVLSRWRDWRSKLRRAVQEWVRGTGTEVE